jgi:hypothetical protein
MVTAEAEVEVLWDDSSGTSENFQAQITPEGSSGILFPEYFDRTVKISPAIGELLVTAQRS